MNSFYQACISFTSQNFGAKNKKNCKKVLVYCQIFAVLTGVILGGIVLIFKDQFLGFYTSNQEAINYGVQRIVIICTTYYLCGIMDVFVGGMRGLGYSVVPMIVSIMGACVFRIVWIHTIFAANHTLFILYISYPQEKETQTKKWPLQYTVFLNSLRYSITQMRKIALTPF